MTILDIGVVGSRSIKQYGYVEATLTTAPEHWMDDPRLISGGAPGVDTLAERYAEENDHPIKVIEPDYTDWSGPERPEKKRNTEIVKQSDGIIAVWDGHSNGTRDTIDKALDRGVPIYIEVV